MDANEQITKAVDFLDREYKPELLEAARTGKKHIDIDFVKLSEDEPELADMLLDEFDEVSRAFELAIEQFDLAVKDIRVRFTHINRFTSKDIWKLRADEVETFISIKGYIRRIGSVQHEVESATFECPSCGNVKKAEMKEGLFSQPDKCGCGRKGKFHLISRKLRDVQKVIVEDDPLMVKPPQKPRTILCVLHDDLCRAEIDQLLQPSKKVAIAGMVKDRRVKPYLAECKKHIEVNNIEVLDESINNIKITEEDIAQFNKMAASKTLYDDLAQSIVPNIKGHKIAKKAILLQLMGGVALYIDGQLEERECIHILLVGSPGTGKSVMLKRAILFMPGSRFTAGKGVSGVGLIAAVTKDEELGWTLDAGVVPMASGAMAAIDELDKISKSDIGHMNNAMVDMRVSIDKANIHGVLETNTMILGAANPKDRIFDRKELIWKQLGLPKDFLDRFDLIFPIQSETTEEGKREVAHLVVGKYREDSLEAKPIYPKDLVIKYIAYARNNYKPVIDKDVEDYIVENFIDIVKPADKEEDQAYFSYRLLTNIIRLTQAVTKTRLSAKATEEDAQLAINILMDSLKAQDILTPDGFNLERAEAIIPKSKRDIKHHILDIIRKLQAMNKDKEADYDAIKKAAIEEYKMNIDDFDEFLEKLRIEGEITEVRRCKYKVIE